MSVTVKLNPILQKLTDGQEAVEVTGCTTGECLTNLAGRFPGIKQQIHDELGELHPYCAILVNSKLAYPKELITPVKDGDEIDIVFFFAGG
jgi:molybdopterin converting factor small subunit